MEPPRNDDIHREQRPPDPIVERIGQFAVDASVDYVALGAEDRRFSGTYRHCLIHSPGTTQAKHSSDTGPKGATLVQIAGDRTISTSFLPTAPVRWERVRISLPASASEDELLQRMRAEMERLRVERSEKVRILQWTVCFEEHRADMQTSSTMAALLGTLTERERLQDRFNRELGQFDDVVCLHRLGFPVPTVIDSLGPDETITRQLLHELEQQSLEAHTVRQCLERAKRIQVDAAERLEDVGAGIDGDQIVKRAHAEVMNWLYALRQAG